MLFLKINMSDNLLKRKFNLYSALSQELTASLSLNTILKKAIRIATELLDAEIGSILLLEPSKNTLKIVASKGLSSKIVKSTSIKLGERISGYVASTKKPLLMKDITKSKFKPANLERYYTHSLISCPLKIKRKVIGVININNKKDKKSFTEFDLNILEGVSSQIAVAIDNARQFEEMQNTYKEVLESLILTIDARDHYTKIHSEKVAYFGERLARKLGLSNSKVNIIKEACYLHDIGKIGIPDSILNKPSKLTSAEFAVMMQHSIIGFNILYPLKFLGEVPWIVRANHERWDGKGYPDGLKETRIPLGARILAICDAYITMRDRRPYKKELTHQQAIKEIEKNSGTQFDPYIAKVFISMF